MGVGPEDAPSGRGNNEVTLHSKPSQASAWPSKPSPPDEGDEDETSKDDESDSDDDFPEFPGFVLLCFAPRRRSSFYLSNLQRFSQRQDCRASNRRDRETCKTHTTQVTFSTRLHLGKYQWIYCHLDRLIDIFLVLMLEPEELPNFYSLIKAVSTSSAVLQNISGLQLHNFLHHTASQQTQLLLTDNANTQALRYSSQPSHSNSAMGDPSFLIVISAKVK